jgi:hypothetical protein
MCSPVHAIKQTRYRVIDHGLPQPPVLVPAEHERAHDPRVVEAHAVKLSRDKVALKDRVGAPARGAGRDSVEEPEDLKGGAAESRVARRVSREGRRRAVLYLVSLRRQVFETARMNLGGAVVQQCCALSSELLFPLSFPVLTFARSKPRWSSATLWAGTPSGACFGACRSQACFVFFCSSSSSLCECDKTNRQVRHCCLRAFGKQKQQLFSNSLAPLPAAPPRKK